MKKILILMLAILSASAVLGQKKKVGIYTDDRSGANIAEFVSDFIANSINKRGVYSAVERTGEFLKLLTEEHKYQQSGNVDENDISRIGKQLKVDFVCAIKVTKSGNQLYMTARFVNVETAELDVTARPKYFDNNNGDEIEATCEFIVASMFGERGSSGGGSSNRSQSYNTQRHPAEPEMVSVQGGTFWMGCSSEQKGDCYDGETPVHQVTVSTFKISKYEITQAQWKVVMGTTIRQQCDKLDPSLSLSGEGDNYPMYYISWDEAQEFISRLNAATGKNYRLPTEAEWEYAARGGNKSQGYKYSGSDNLSDVAWCSDNSGNRTHPVGTKQSNELGIYDMSGNVFEWCYDWYGTYSASAQRDPIGASSGSNRVLRGGSWRGNVGFCRVANRYSSGSSGPSRRANYLGFRLVLPE